MSRAVSALSLVMVQVATVLVGAVAPLARPSGPAPVSSLSLSTAPEPLVHPRSVVVHVVDARPVRRARHVAVRRTRYVVQRVRHGSTARERVMRAVGRIPGYRTGDALWRITPRYGHWGVADWYRGIAYISPSVPAGLVYSVVVHEWSHLLSVRVYGGDVSRAVSAMNAYFGGRDLVGAERAADCMARLLGATWTHYTRCADSHWRAGARRLLSHRQL